MAKRQSALTCNFVAGKIVRQVKKLLTVSLISLFAVFLSINVVFATDSVVGTRFEQFREKMQEKRDKLEQKRSELKEKMASKQAELREKRRGFIRETLLKIIKHLVNAQNRLNKIADKIANRLEKVKARGVDTTAWQASLESCRSHNSSVDAAIAAAKAKVEAIDVSVTEFNGSVREARDSILAARRELNSYRACLVDVMRQINLSRDLREASESAD